MKVDGKGGSVLSRKFWIQWISLLVLVIAFNLIYFSSTRLKEPIILKNYVDIEYTADDENEEYKIKFPIIRDLKFGNNIKSISIADRDESLYFNQRIGRRSKRIELNDMIIDVNPWYKYQTVNSTSVGKYVLIESEVYFSKTDLEYLIDNKNGKLNSLKIEYENGKKESVDIGEIRILKKQTQKSRDNTFVGNTRLIRFDKANSLKLESVYKNCSKNKITLKKIQLSDLNNLCVNNLNKIDINNKIYEIKDNVVNCDLNLNCRDELKITWEINESIKKNIGFVDKKIVASYEENNSIKEAVMKFKIEPNWIDRGSIQNLREGSYYDGI